MGRKCWFLIGGTGNQLFQIARAQQNDAISGLFLRPGLRKLLGQTDHETILPDLLHLRLKTPWVNLLALVLDMLIAGLFKKSLFTDFDIRRFKVCASVRSINALGYFQDQIDHTSYWLEQARAELRSETSESTVAVHFRGGDFLTLSNNTFGVLAAGYYVAALEAALANTASVALRVYTNDAVSARTFFGAAEFDRFDIEFIEEPLEPTLRSLVTAKTFVASNSTLSYCVLILRGDSMRSFRPQPFNLRDSLPPPTAGTAVTAQFLNSSGTNDVG